MAASKLGRSWYFSPRARGSIFVYSLVMVSLVMLIAVVTHRLAFLKENILESRAAAQLEEIEETSLLNQFLKDLKGGLIPEVGDFRKEHVFQGRRYLVKTSANGPRRVKVSVSGAHSAKSYELHIQPASDFFEVFSQGVTLSGGKDQRPVTGPIYSPSVKLSLDGGDLVINAPPGVSVPLLVSKAPVEVTGLGSLVVTVRKSSLLGGIQTNRVPAGELGEDQRGRPFRPEIGRAELSQRAFCVPEGERILQNEFPGRVKIPNPYLNRKKKIGVASGFDRESIRGREGEGSLEGSRVYFLNPEMTGGYREGDLVDSFAWVDSLNAAPSYRWQGGGFVMNPRDEATPLPLTREMFLGKATISLGVPGKVFISSGRSIDSVEMNGTPVSFTYSSESRVLTLGNAPYLKSLFRGDGRKARYSLRELSLGSYPVIMFENGKPLMTQVATGADGGQEIAFSPPPSYGALIEAVVTLPDIRIKKSPLKRGTVVLIDSVIEARVMDLSKRLPSGLHLKDSFPDALYLLGKMKGDLSIKTPGDIYLGAVTNTSGYTLFVDCRYLFLAKGSEAGDMRRLILRQKGEAVRSLGFYPSTLRGSFIFDKDDSAQSGSGVTREVSDASFGFSVPKLEYDETFVADPFKGVFFYRIL